MNAVDWNNVLANVITEHAKESQAAAASLELSMKVKIGELQTIGTINVHKNKVKLYWGNGDDDDDEKHGENEKDDNNDDDDDDDDDKEEMPKAFKKLIGKEKGTRTGCATTPKEIKLLHEDDDEAAQILVSEVDHTEWWTMVSPLYDYCLI